MWSGDNGAGPRRGVHGHPQWTLLQNAVTHAAPELWGWRGYTWNSRNPGKAHHDTFRHAIALGYAVNADEPHIARVLAELERPSERRYLVANLGNAEYPAYRKAIAMQCIK